MFPLFFRFSLFFWCCESGKYTRCTSQSSPTGTFYRLQVIWQSFGGSVCSNARLLSPLFRLAVVVVVGVARQMLGEDVEHTEEKVDATAASMKDLAAAAAAATVEQAEADDDFEKAKQEVRILLSASQPS